MNFIWAADLLISKDCEKEKLCGIYKILCLKTWKCYIGQSVDILGRRIWHLEDLLAGIHHSSKLQNAWNFYGPDVFEFHVIEFCEECDLDDKEINWIEKEKSFFDGYNCTKGGDTSWRHLNADPDFQKHRMALMELHYQDPEWVKKVSDSVKKSIANNPNWGPVHSDVMSRLNTISEFREKRLEGLAVVNANPEFQKRRQAALAIVQNTIEYRNKLSEAGKKVWEDITYREQHLERVITLGKNNAVLMKEKWEDDAYRTMHLEQITTLGKSHKGVPRSQETRDKISKSKKNKPLTEDHKRKISEGLKKAREKKKLEDK